MKLTKTFRRRLLQEAKTLLTHRRNGRVKYEQASWEKVERMLEGTGLEVWEVIQQAEDHLRKTSIAASMNGIV
jgi:hypothetical protein